MSKSLQLLVQLGLILASAAVAYLLLSPETTKQADGSTTTTTSSQSSFDMLGFLDDQISCQENEKDVRCWSSVNKLQMFVAGASIEHEAAGVRISSYHHLLDDVWQAAADNVDGQEISEQELQSVLSGKFPHENNAETGNVKFEFEGSEEPVLVMQALVQDYSDTIEPWRILQSWASTKVDAGGQLELKPIYSQPAIESFHSFLVAFDIALLKRAKAIAVQNKLATIDAESMTKAFELN